MAKGGGSAPAPPNPAATARAQEEANWGTFSKQLQATPNYTTPFGSQTNTTFEKPNIIDPGGDPILGMTSETTYDPTVQSAINEQMAGYLGLSQVGNQQVGALQDSFADPFSIEGLDPRTSNIDTAGFSPYTGDPGQSMSDAMYEQATSRLDPQWNQASGDLESRLANQGIVPGSEAYNREMENFGRGRNDAYNQANLSSIQAGIGTGLTQRGQQFNEAGAQAGLSNAQREQELQENYFLRSVPMNELTAMLGGAQVPIPQFGPVTTPGLPTVDHAGIAQQGYQNQLAQYNANQQGAGGIAGPAIGALGSLFSFLSSKTLKTNFADVGTVLDKMDAVPVKRWNYKGDNQIHIGPFAEDFNEAFDLPRHPFIQTLDAFGVCLQAIKELKAEIKELKEAR